MADSLTLTERLDWLQLARSRGVGPKTFYRLLHRFGSARRAFEGAATDFGGDRRARTPPLSA